MKVAIITEYLLQSGGAEKVIAAIAELYPKADIFSLIGNDKVIEKHFGGHKVIEHPAFRNAKWKRKFYRMLFPLYPTYIEDFDLSGYDLVISSSYLWAKGVLTDLDATHISYVHTPMRQAWVKYHEYMNNENDIGPVKRFFLRYVMNYVRLWDVVNSNRVDHFIANSTTVKRRIEKIYRRPAQVIHPPIEVADHNEYARPAFGKHYVTLGRLVPYKRVDLLIEAFNQCPERELYIMGDGNDRPRLEKLATSPNIHLMGYVDDAQKMEILASARGFLFAAEEDFGMSPVEAMAAGIPVVGYGKGGTRDYIIDGQNGLFFDEQTPEALLEAIDQFEQMQFDKQEVMHTVEHFSTAGFKYKFENFVNEVLAQQKIDQKETNGGSDNTGWPNSTNLYAV